MPAQAVSKKYRHSLGATTMTGLARRTCMRYWKPARAGPPPRMGTALKVAGAADSSSALARACIGKEQHTSTLSHNHPKCSTTAGIAGSGAPGAAAISVLCMLHAILGGEQAAKAGRREHMPGAHRPDGGVGADKGADVALRAAGAVPGRHSAGDGTLLNGGGAGREEATRREHAARIQRS